MCINTLLLKANRASDVLKAIQLLRQGEVVAIPTETVYGLAGDAQNEAAVHKIFAAKHRPANHPLIVHIASFDSIQHWVQELPRNLEKLAQAFWPGSLTVLLKKAPWVSPVVTGGLDTIGIRIPNNPIVLKILDELNTGVAAPSANPHKKISPTTAEHVLSGLNGKIAAVLDDGACSVGLESTILDLTQARPKILRAGPITQLQLERVLGCQVDNPLHHCIQVAGNMKEHYQPKTPAHLLSSKQMNHYLEQPSIQNKAMGILHYTHVSQNHPLHHFIRMPNDSASYAKRLYHAMHQIDRLKLDQILIEAPPDLAEWQAVRDRLTKATA